MIPFPFQQGGLGFTQIGPTAVTGWTPADLTVPAAVWMNDDSPIGTVGSLCTQWNDITGNARHFTNAAAGAPSIIPLGLNSRRTIRFAANAFLYNNSSDVKGLFRNTGAGWIFIVCRRLSVDGGAVSRNLFVSTNGSDGSSRFVSAISSTANTPALLARRLDADSTSTMNAVGTTGTGWHRNLFMVDWTNGDGFIHIDGALNASSTTFTSNGSTSNTDAVRAVCIGAYPNDTSAPPGIVNPCDAEIAEIVVGRGSLPTSGEITDLFAYATRRWGV